MDFNRCNMDLNLTTKVNSKKNVDFNDSRYQLSDKLKPTTNKNIRQTFTVYDNRDDSAISSNEIAAAYALSDKKIPIGELLTKMTDFIVDLSDGELNSDENAVRAWKYSRALLIIYADKKKRGESLTVFDNSLKNTVINCPVFIEKYPGKYTLQTNFFDPKVIQGLIDDIVDTFEHDTVPKIHVAAMKQSRESAEAHQNPALDRIVQWAVNKYECTAQTFFDINDDPETGLKYATNTVILHLKNGYDMSIVGYTGTEHDNQFSISVFDSNNLQINFTTDKCTPEELRKKLISANEMDAVAPITRLIRIEEERNKVLHQQYDILKDIRPMIPADILGLEAAESVVGHDYIWGCNEFRLTHNDLPADFSLSDVQLPEFDESMVDNNDAANAIGDVLGEIAANQQTPTNKGTFAKLNAGEHVNIDEDIPDKPKEKDNYMTSTLLPGFIPVKKEEKPNGPSVTSQAQKAPEAKKPLFKDIPKTTLPKTPSKPAQEAQEPQKPVATPDISATRLPLSESAQPVTETPKPVENVPQTPSTMLPHIPEKPVEQPQKETPKAAPHNGMDIEDMFA